MTINSESVKKRKSVISQPGSCQHFDHLKQTISLIAFLQLTNDVLAQCTLQLALKGFPLGEIALHNIPGQDLFNFFKSFLSNKSSYRYETFYVGPQNLKKKTHGSFHIFSLFKIWRKNIKKMKEN